MKLITLAAAVAAVAGAPLLAQAEQYKLDLPKGELATPQGQKAVAAWAGQLADQVCGPTDMPQPIDLVGARADCRSNVIARVHMAAQRQAAKDRKDAAQG